MDDLIYLTALFSLKANGKIIDLTGKVPSSSAMDRPCMRGTFEMESLKVLGLHIIRQDPYDMKAI